MLNKTIHKTVKKFYMQRCCRQIQAVIKIVRCYKKDRWDQESCSTLKKKKKSPTFYRKYQEQSTIQLTKIFISYHLSEEENGILKNERKSNSYISSNDLLQHDTLKKVSVGKCNNKRKIYVFLVF